MYFSGCVALLFNSESLVKRYSGLFIAKRSARSLNVAKKTKKILGEKNLIPKKPTITRTSKKLIRKGVRHHSAATKPAPRM